jgi:hypothetical protein
MATITEIQMDVDPKKVVHARKFFNYLRNGKYYENELKGWSILTIMCLYSLWVAAEAMVNAARGGRQG